MIALASYLFDPNWDEARLNGGFYAISHSLKAPVWQKPHILLFD